MTNGNNRNTFLAGIAMDLIDNNPHSPTDSSEDSVEVKVEAIAFRSKRKLTEPRRLHDGPLKKRACIRAEDTAPFRPWSLSPPKSTSSSTSLSPSATVSAPPPRQYFRPPSPPPQEARILAPPQPISPPQTIRIPIHPKHSATSGETDEALSASGVQFPKLKVPVSKSTIKDIKKEKIAKPSQDLEGEDDHMLDDAYASSKDNQRKEQRNYKNMTRERRIEANARERTRVHTISAAFDTLRHAVPAYSHSQKLSKLSVLRIACSYIMTLSNLLEDSPDVAESVENVSRTIQREGKLRKKKDE